MKYLFIFLLAIFFSCQSADNETLDFLNKGVELCNWNIEARSSEYYSRFEAAMQENPASTKPHKQKTDSIQRISDQLLSLIDSIKQSIIENNDTIGDISYLYDSQNNANIQLQQKIDEYNQLISHLNSTDSVLYKSKLNIKYPLEIAKETTILSLNRLVNQIQVINHQLVTSYYKNISGKDFGFRTFVPVVIPKKRRLKMGETFEAKVFLTTIDTTINLQMITQKDTLYSKNGYIHFEQLPDKLGVKNTGAVLQLKQPKTGKVLTFPFKINYEVVKN